MLFSKSLARVLVVSGVMVCAATAVAACGSDDSGPPTQTVTLDFVNTVVEGQRFVRSVEDSGQEFQYGTLVFNGPGTFDGQSVDTEVIGTVNYVDGAGPAGGYLTLTTPDGDVLAFDLELTATTTEDEVKLTGRFEVIAGTGRFEDVTGGGTATGTREVTVGSTVTWTAKLELAGLEG
jgi:hypothetical protein